MKKRIIENISVQEKKGLLDSFAPFLGQGSFINVATCSRERMPSVAPKLVAKTENNVVYLVDYVLGRTYANLKDNPRASLSFIDDRTLTGYQLNGTVDIVESGAEFEKLSGEFQQIKTNLTVERILFNLRAGVRHKAAELSLPEEFAVLRIKIFEIVEISSSGGLKSRLTLG